ncbi:MAG: hypothetical protein ACPKQO_04780 [Nitrososphaeraceae archaeon]
MLKSKIGIFSALMFGVMMLLIPATSIANAQEYNDRYYEEDEYVYEEYYFPSKDKKEMKPAILKITKELFMCDNILNVNETNPNFECEDEYKGFQFTAFFPQPPDSDQYVSCDDIECPGIDESDFSAAVYKDIAIARDLSSTEQTSVDLTKINYIVSEDRADDVINQDGDQCSIVGFNDGTNYEAILSDELIVDYEICVLYEGDCEGTIHPGEVKECTVKNFIYEGEIRIVEKQTS